MAEPTPLAVLTGTSSGIGEAVARALIDRRWRVIGLARRPSALRHDAYTHLQLDLADLTTLADRIEAEIGPAIDAEDASRIALLNNAASPGFLGTVGHIEPAAMLDVFAVNVAAPSWLMGWIVRRSDPDVPVRIVNVSSGAGINPYPGLGTYGGTKAALRMIGMVLAAELDMAKPRRDVTVLSYSPGPVDTPMQEMARAAPLEAFPLHDTFARWATDGTLVPPHVPAEEIVTYMERDGDPGFMECRVGELPTPRC